VKADPPLELAPRTPGWVAPLVMVVVFLAGAAPITAGLVRFVRRR
jgi:hypothetical protein